MKIIIQILLAIALTVIIGVVSQQVLLNFGLKQTYLLVPIFALLSVWVFFLRKHRVFYYGYVTISSLLIGVILYLEYSITSNHLNPVNQHYSNNTQLKTPMDTIFLSMESIPKSWGEIYIHESDTFKFLGDCNNARYSVILFEGNLTFPRFSYDSYDYGINHFQIDSFSIESPNRFRFEMHEEQSGKKDVWLLDIIDSKGTMGNWTSINNSMFFRNHLANFNTKDFPDKYQACGD